MATARANLINVARDAGLPEADCKARLELIPKLLMHMRFHQIKEVLFLTGFRRIFLMV